jgi:hypothetical protein
MNSAKHIEIIRNLILQAMNCLEEDQVGNPLSDLFIQVDRQNGEVAVVADNEETLAKEVVFDWVQPDEEEEVFYSGIAPDLKTAVGQLNGREVFDKIYIVKPFSVSLVNEDLSVMEELLFLDDDTLKLDDDIWKAMDKELDLFLKGLLSDPK